MDNFINKHISIVNKNNTIILKIGKINNNQFNIRLSEHKIKQFMSKLYEKYPHIKKYRVNSDKKIYKYKNSITEINRKGYEYYSYELKDTQIVQFNDNNIKLVLLNKKDQDECLSSIYKYHVIENIEEYCMDINNMFNIIISNIEYESNRWFTITIEIKKPNIPKKICHKITQILELI
jgi:K+/H+ antiporter YhaU regulatory subunit KhtT